MLLWVTVVFLPWCTCVCARECKFVYTCESQISTISTLADQSLPVQSHYHWLITICSFFIQTYIYCHKSKHLINIDYYLVLYQGPVHKQKIFVCLCKLTFLSMWTTFNFISLNTVDISKVYTVNARFKSWGLINFMFHNHPGSNQERVAIKTLKI